jgi:hypothetical protein
MKTSKWTTKAIITLLFIFLGYIIQSPILGLCTEEINSTNSKMQISNDCENGILLEIQEFMIEVFTGVEELGFCYYGFEYDKNIGLNAISTMPSVINDNIYELINNDKNNQ